MHTRFSEERKNTRRMSQKLARIQPICRLTNMSLMSGIVARDRPKCLQQLLHATYLLDASVLKSSEGSIQDAMSYSLNLS